jgi:hypothetical protein
MNSPGGAQSIEQAPIQNDDQRDHAIEKLQESNQNLEDKFKELSNMLNKTVQKFGFEIVKVKDKKGVTKQDIQKDPNHKPEEPVNSEDQELMNKKDIKLKHLNVKAHNQQKKIGQLKQDVAYFDNSLLKDPVNIQN